MSNYKKTILIDLDGVLNIYTGNYDENFIPPIQDGAKSFLEKLSVDYKVKIFTTRTSMLATQWVINNGLQDCIDGVTNIKEPSYLQIDDRCIKFDGNYDNIIEQINNFQVWYK